MSEARCPWCGRANDCHDEITGDVSICWKCRRLAVFTGPGMLRRPTEAETAELMAHPDVRRAVGAIAESYTPQQAVALTREQERR